ncbi:DUF4097 family beta strand repeat-containing protein [Spirillospora sp. NPDC047279]|uniref:DUF4097 family beta strand repeat-containing protein n=1 Tax=Spirillospora sp. NPDC047279 TaxID=3155478 RepID=UPI0033CBC624
MKTLTGTMALAGAAVSALALSGCSVDLDAGEKHENRSYQITQKVTSIKVTSDVGKVEVVGTDAAVVKVAERLTWTSEHRKPKPSHGVAGGTLTLGAKCEGNVIGFSSCGVAYRVEVPRGTSLDLHNDDGALKVSGLRGAVRLSTDTGSITATGLEASSLFARTGDGSIRLNGRAANAELRTDTGSIKGDGLNVDRLTAHTGDGTINVRFTAPPGSVDATTDTGSVELAVPTGEPYAISLKADTGSLDVDAAVRRDDAAPRKIKVRTGDGSVDVRPA